MTYKLFKQQVGGGVGENNPMEQALWSEQATRSAVGYVEGTVVQITLSYSVKDGEESYKLRVDLESGRHWTERYNNKFGGDAVFEKLVRDYDLFEDPDKEDLEKVEEQVSEDRGTGDDRSSWVKGLIKAGK